ncbi:MAG: autotransporter outer rane beta-barrel protein [Caulobacteraceae bacterium]|nr:autotransporter outer rane beta-barrel protein [Caulobacteraceae bacterium]
MRYRLAALAAVSALAMGSGARADSLVFNTPHLDTVAGSESAILSGSTFVNQGLVGVGRLSPNLLDFRGESLGSFSSLAVVRKAWHRNADGSYGGFLYTLPDRGPNNVGGLVTTDYAARLNGFDFSFTPYTGSAALASGTTQLTLRQVGGILLTDATGQVFTGRDPQAGVVTRNGINYPMPPTGDTGAGKIAIDSEGLVLLADGSFYVSDEYGAMVYYFDKTGKQLGAIQAGPDINPTVGGVTNFNGTNDAVFPFPSAETGRRSNQGMEGVSVSPDGTRLYTLLQSATLQDNPTNVAQRRNNTRLMVYDISTTKTPTAPIAEYVLQLPVYNSNGSGAAANATAAQSEVLALNDHQFLVLSRDGNGRGTDGNAKPVVFKSVLLVDTVGATNIAGTTYATSATPISTTADANGAGALISSITPMQQTEVVNMLNTTQLSKFGINTTTNPSTQFTLSEKWEAMGLLPALDEAHPQDYFLLLGNDNDFVSANATVVDDPTTIVANTSLTNPAAGTGVNDNQMMVYRLTLPTYIDPEALAQLNYQFRVTAGFVNDEAAAQASAATDGPMAQLDAARRAEQDGQAFGSGVRVWSQSSMTSTSLGQDFGARDAAVSFGVDSGFAGLARAGLFGGLQTSHGSNHTRVDSWTLGVSGGFKANGFYGQAAVGHGEVDGQYSRPAAYYQYANGDVGGDLTTSQVEIGWLTKTSGVELGPFASYAQVNGSIDAVTENGASVSNVIAAKRDIKRTSSRFGVELSGKAGAAAIAVLKLGYENRDQKDKAFNASLAAVSGAGGTVVLKPGDTGHDGLFASIAVESNSGPFNWRVGVDAKDSGDKTDLGVSLGLAQRF